MSVTFAPRARMAVNASWPGVSRKVILRPSWSTWYAPMCCVIPPASVSTTDGLADRVEQRRLAVVDVAHDRDDRRPGDEVLLGVLEASGSSSSSAACLIVISRLDLGGDQLDLVVGQRLRHRLGHLAEAPSGS